MPQRERQQSVLTLLKDLRGLGPLKELFWSELNYERVNQPLPRRAWTDTAVKALAEDPLLFAGGGTNNDFHVIYARLAWINCCWDKNARSSPGSCGTIPTPCLSSPMQHRTGGIS